MLWKWNQFLWEGTEPLRSLVFSSTVEESKLLGYSTVIHEQIAELLSLDSPL